MPLKPLMRFLLIHLMNKGNNSLALIAESRGADGLSAFFMCPNGILTEKRIER